MNTVTVYAPAVAGRGLAGKCPGRHDPKTPAVQERVCRVAAAGGYAGVNPARATAQQAGEGVA